MEQTTVSTIVELPEVLEDSVTRYLESHPKWDRERLMQGALSLFLLQNGSNEAHVNSLYLDSLFNGAQ